VHLEMTFKGHTLLWYKKYQTTIVVGKSRILVDIGSDLLKEFQKPKYES
jgi:hypothetical protein